MCPGPGWPPRRVHRRDGGQVAMGVVIVTGAIAILLLAALIIQAHL